MLLNKEGKYEEDPMLKKVIGMVICSLPKPLGGGHIRGKRVESQDNGKVKIFACPRCGRRTEYKAKVAT